MEQDINKLEKSGGKKLKEKMLETIKKYQYLTEEEKNCLHIYYGNGKGKTTSAIGLIIRALGAGKKVALVQFDKGYDGANEHYSERLILRELAEMGHNIEMFPTGCERMNTDGTFRFKNMTDDFTEAKRGLKISRNLIAEGAQDLLVLDELIAAVDYNLLSRIAVEELIDLYKKNRRFELVMTGHKLWNGLKEKADLITEMRKVKHYFDLGIPARAGIEF
jgi:cob(I)alamin adenosyltransferase